MIEQINLSFLNPHSVIEDWGDCFKQNTVINDYEYDVGNLITFARELEPFDLQIKGMNINYDAPCHNGLRDFVTQYGCNSQVSFELSYDSQPNSCDNGWKTSFSKSVTSWSRVNKSCST